MRYLLIVLLILCGGCTCFYVKTPDVEACYCRGGDQSIEVGEFSQESDGDVPSALGALIEAWVK